jgi:mono/diheme cytochrome c family protein
VIHKLALAVVAAALAAALGGCYDSPGSQTAQPAPPPAATEAPPATTEAPPATTEAPPSGGSAEAGKAVFASAGCGSCHTLAAAGANATVGPNLDETQPSSDLVVERVTNGSGVMPPFKDSLSEEQILDVAAFVSGSAGK